MNESERFSLWTSSESFTCEQAPPATASTRNNSPCVAIVARCLSIRSRTRSKPSEQNSPQKLFTISGTDKFGSTQPDPSHQLVSHRGKEQRTRTGPDVRFNNTRPETDANACPAGPPPQNRQSHEAVPHLFPCSCPSAAAT